MKKSKYKDDIEFLSSKGTMTAREIAEEVGCSIVTVYLFAHKGCFKNLHPKRRMVNGLLRCGKCKQYYPTENFNKDKIINMATKAFVNSATKNKQKITD